jgi:Zn-dependent protease with chaperone function
MKDPRGGLVSAVLAGASINFVLIALFLVELREAVRLMIAAWPVMLLLSSLLWLPLLVTGMIRGWARWRASRAVGEGAEGEARAEARDGAPGDR